MGLFEQPSPMWGVVVLITKEGFHGIVEHRGQQPPLPGPDASGVRGALEKLIGGKHFWDRQWQRTVLHTS
jgi:hypothetical protein